MEAVECGAASLCCLMGYYKKYVPLEDVREMCGVSRDGAKASNILKAARSYGFTAKGSRQDIAGLQQLGKPCIVFWNFNHFVVVEGFSENKVYINDPGAGPTTLSTEEFSTAFTGVSLLIEPGPTFVANGEAPSLVKTLLSRFPHKDQALYFLIICGLLMVIPGLLLPVLTQSFVDDVLVAKLTDWLPALLLGLSLVTVVRAALTWVQRTTLARFRVKLSLSMSGRFLWHVLRLPVVFYTQRSAGDISGRVSSNDRVADLLAGDLANTILNVWMVAFFAILMLIWDWALTLVGLLVVVINMLLLRAISRKRQDLSQRIASDIGKLGAVSMNGLMMIETYKASGLENDFFAKVTGIQAKVVNGQREMDVLGIVLDTTPPVLAAINTAIILMLGSLRVMDGDLSVGTLVAFHGLMVSFMEPTQQLMGLAGRFQAAHGELNRIDDVLRYPPDPLAPAAQAVSGIMKDPDFVRLTGHLRFEEVAFGYNRLDAPFIKGFNLELRPGMRVALVGASGSGKSTITQLLMGLYAPWAGEILLDGKPRAAHDRHTLMSSIAVVNQDIHLFEGSIRDNLTMWDPDLPQAQMQQAAQDACIHDVIATRTGGYESMVLEGGSNFSGGQRQRLEIARALANNPQLLVLDEATSALDPLTEQTIEKNLRRRGCTCVIIAHRLSTIRDCDEILYLDAGRVVERGTHEQLMDRKGHYYRLMRQEEAPASTPLH
jgi:NHLM bacteriocin system ABC transporter peptidase/ATP-binding protein